MKSRYRKHVDKLVKNSPIVGFSQTEVFEKNQLINTNELKKLNKYAGLEKDDYADTRYRDYRKQMYSDLLLFVDNYFVCGNHEYVYLLVPTKENQYKVTEKESLNEWARNYWNREDPKNERDWCYFDEDTVDLFNYITNKFDKSLKNKITRYNFM